MFKVLDLFAGVGGTAKGIQKFFLNTSTPFSYVAVDNNYQVLEAHKKLNSLSSTKVYVAWEL